MMIQSNLIREYELLYAKQSLTNSIKYKCPGKNQSAQIAREKLFELYQIFPLLKKELIGEGSYSSDYVSLKFRNGSVFDVVSALNSQRGGRRGGGILDEYR